MFCQEVGESNLKRRQLTIFARTELVLKLEPHYAKRAKQNQGTRTDLNIVQNSAPGKTRDILAEKADTDPHKCAARGDTRDIFPKKAQKEAGGDRKSDEYKNRLPHESGKRSRHENETAAKTAKEVGLKRTQYERLKKIEHTKSNYL